MKVLIVDGDDDVRELMCATVEGAGFEVEGAADAVSALTTLARHETCAVVLDLLLPGMDGWELYRRLTGHATFASVPIIVCTSIPERAPAGATVVPKPIDPDRLVQSVRAACGAAP